MNINYLPEEVLIKIFQYLTQNELAYIARYVCILTHLMSNSIYFCLLLLLQLTVKFILSVYIYTIFYCKEAYTLFVIGNIV